MSKLTIERLCAIETIQFETDVRGAHSLHPLVRLPAKPRWGTACNGCGLCCAQELCVAGEVAFPGASAPCPALKIRSDGKSTYCQLVAIEIVAGLKPMLQEALGIGKGCSMPDEISTDGESRQASLEGRASPRSISDTRTLGNECAGQSRQPNKSSSGTAAPAVVSSGKETRE